MTIVDIPSHTLSINIFLHSWGFDSIARRRAANCMLCRTLFALLTMVARTSTVTSMLGAIGVN